MLYNELKNLTNGEATVKEYEIVNRVYMEMHDMTKEGAADLWKYLFGKQHRDAKREKNRVDAQCHDFKWFLEFIGNRSGAIALPNGDWVDVVWSVWEDGVVRVDLWDIREGKITIAERNNRGELEPVQRRYFKKSVAA